MNLPARATSVTLGHDTNSNLTELLELAVEPLLIHVPGEVANEEVVGASASGLLSLGLLGGGGRLVLGLALLGLRGLFLRLGLRRVRVRRVRRVLGGRLGLLSLLQQLAWDTMFDLEDQYLPSWPWQGPRRSQTQSRSQSRYRWTPWRQPS